jgi:hypothetical protein
MMIIKYKIGVVFIILQCHLHSIRAETWRLFFGKIDIHESMNCARARLAANEKALRMIWNLLYFSGDKYRKLSCVWCG